MFYDDENVNIKFKLETSKKVKNIVTIQWIIMQEVLIMKPEEK